MTWLIGLAEALGIPAKFAKPAVIAAIVLLLALGGGLAKCTYDRSIIERHDDKQELKTVKRLQNANDKAAADRAAETVTLNSQEQELHDAVHSAPDAAPSAPSVRLNCERLRRAGTDVSSLPACS